MMRFILLVCAVLAYTYASAVELSSSTFYDLVGKDTGVLVEFYTPWCSHCKHLEPIYNQLADSFSHSNKVSIAKIDADENKKFVRQFGVKGYPTIKYFEPNNGGIIDFTGFRGLDELSRFVTQHSHAHPLSQTPSTASVVELTNENFDSHVFSPSKPNTLVMFYAPWCGHCKALMPTFDAVAETYARDDNCQLAKINVDDKSNAEIGTRYKIGGFPTLKMFKDGEDAPLHYDKARTHAAFVEYLNDHCGTHRQLNGELNEDAGVVSELEETVKEFMHSTNQQRLAIAEQLHSSPHKVYLRVMSKIITNGADYLHAESERVSKLLQSKVQDTKRDQLTMKKNVLRRFQQYLHQHVEL
ncbi:hypothetical protein E3P99_03078 [Wallemia hederae]|uniref:protein disulfide-isomerase n=1 Tax=Wallemia hederae TaxID=1540922 RepID=A0A4T0FHK9_9BASI|nr:hypothetical protein E3P99_03078 [Wallemia hederae]